MMALSTNIYSLSQSNCYMAGAVCLFSQVARILWLSHSRGRWFHLSD